MINSQKQVSKDKRARISEPAVVRRMHIDSRNISKAVPSLEVGKVWPWGQAMGQVLSHESQLLRLG